MTCHVPATTQLYLTRAESRDLTCIGRESGIKWDQVGSSGINFDPDSEIVRFGAIFEYCCDIVRIMFLGAIFSDFWQKLRFVAVGLP